VRRRLARILLFRSARRKANPQNRRPKGLPGKAGAGRQLADVVRDNVKGLGCSWPEC